MFKVPSQQLRDTLTTAFKRYLTVKEFMDISQHANSFLSKHHKKKMGEGTLEIITWIKIKSCSLKNTAPGHFICYCILLFSLSLSLSLSLSQKKKKKKKKDRF